MNSSARDQIDRINKHVEIVKCSCSPRTPSRHILTHMDKYQHLLLHLFVLCLFYSFELWLIDAFIFLLRRRFDCHFFCFFLLALCWALIFVISFHVDNPRNRKSHSQSDKMWILMFFNVDLVRPNENTDFFSTLKICMSRPGDTYTMASKRSRHIENSACDMEFWCFCFSEREKNALSLIRWGVDIFMFFVPLFSLDFRWI